MCDLSHKTCFSRQDDLSQYSTKIDTTKVPAEAKKKAERVAREIELRLSHGGPVGQNDAKRRMVDDGGWICNENLIFTIYLHTFRESSRIM